MCCSIVRKTFSLSVLAVAAMLASSSPAAAQPFLYGATGSGGTAGSLYILSQSNGSVVQTIGTLEDAGGNDYGITGLAWNPVTSTLYGSTATISPTGPRSLVTINPLTALVTPVGSFNIPAGGTMSDISFQPGTNTLYGWNPQTNAIFTINLATAAVTQIGGSTAGLQGGGGLAFRSDGVLFATPDESNLRTLFTINPTTGVLTPVNARAADGVNVNALAFNGPTLYGSFSPGPPNPTFVGTINTSTAAGTLLGPAVLNLDAIEFLPIPEPTSMILVGTAVAGYLGFRRRRRKALPVE